MLGRHQDSDIVLSNPRVSRLHAKLYGCQGKFYIEDLGSRNGTVVNGTRIGDSTQLKDRDWVEIGDTVFEFSDEGRLVSSNLLNMQSIRRQQGEGGGVAVMQRPTAEYVPSYDSVCAQASPQVKLQAVLQITRDLGTCLDSEDIYQRTLDCAARIFPHAESVEILQADRITGNLIPVTKSKLPAEDDTTISSGPNLKAAVKQAIESGAAVVGDTWDESTNASRTAWYMCAPLIAPCGDVFGVIHLEFRYECNSCVSEDQEILTCIAILAAQSLAHVQAHGERYRAVVNTSAQAILTFDEAGVIESANPASGQVFACDSEKLIGWDIASLFPQVELHNQRERGKFLRHPGQPPVEVVGCRADERRFPAELSLAEFKLDGQSHFTVVCQDISKRKRAEQALRHSRERLSRIVQTGIVGIAFGDLCGGIIEVNGAFSRLTGYARQELIAGTDGWRRITAPEYFETDRQALQALRTDGMYGPYEKEFICRDGRRLPVSVSVALLPGNADEYVVFVVDNSRQKKAEQQLRKLNASLEKTVAERTRNVRLLQDVAVISNAADSVEDAFKAAVTTICHHMDWPAGYAFLSKAEEGPEAFVQVGQWLSNPAAPPVAGRLPDRLVAQVIATGNPGHSRGAAVTPRDQRPPGEGAEAVASVLAFPVRLGKKVWGVLEFFAAPSTVPTDDLLHLMTHVCVQLGRVVERRQLQQELIDAVWSQHRQFGQELHDTLGQELTGIRMMAETLRSKLDSRSSPEAHAADELTQYIREAQDHARQLSKGLMPVDIFQLGLTAALEDLADHATKQTDGLDCVFVCDRPIEIRGNQLATHLFRIAQEAVNNAIKHSESQCIELSLVERGAWLVLQIYDDGIGFEEMDATSSQGMGLRIMRYRANAIGGTLTIEHGEERGTKVRCMVEIHHDADQGVTESQSQAARRG
jgi:PAS domain S-box-containing protein